MNSTEAYRLALIAGVQVSVSWGLTTHAAGRSADQQTRASKLEHRTMYS